MTTIKLRRGTAAQWATANPVLAAGEPGFETDTGKHKIGDGVAAWSHLEYFLPESAIASMCAPKIDLGQQARGPLFIAHRGGHLVHGEHSLEAYAHCAESGFAIEPDINMLSDGGLACIHDSTTSRTMMQIDGASQTTVANITSAAFVRDYRVLPEVQGSPYERPVRFDEVLDLFGGRVLVVPEMKNAATRTAVVKAIEVRGLQKAVLCQSFNFADVAYSASRDIPSMWLTDTGDPITAAARGIRYIGATTGASRAYVDSCIAAGLRVIRYTVNKRSDATAFLADGASGVFTDDPWWVSGMYTKAWTDPFRRQVPWPHMVSTGARSNLIFRDGGFGYRHDSVTSATTGAPQDWCLPIASGKARILFTLAFGPNSAQTDRFVGLAFGQFADAEGTYLDSNTPTQFAHHILVRRNGELQIYEAFAGASVTLRATTAGSALAAAGRASGNLHFLFDRTATALSLTNLLSGESVTWADGNLRPDSRFAFTFNQTDAVFKDVCVEPTA